MSNDDVSRKISDYLAAHPYMTLATVGDDGSPVAHTLGYASEGTTVYFMTDKNTRKAKNISSNPSVAYTVDEDYTDLGKIQGVQMKGTAEPVTDGAVIGKVMGIMAEKFPQLKEMPENPDYVFFKIAPKEAYFLDNTVSFGHREQIII